MDNVEIVTPKAEDCDLGMGYNHEYLEIKTITGEIVVKKIENGEIVGFNYPSTEYMSNDHWNNYLKPKT